MHCKCQLSHGEFATWTRFQEIANTEGGTCGFGDVTLEPGVYCIRVSRLGETDPDIIVQRYRDSQVYRALQTLYDASKHFFDSCGFGPADWGWSGYVEDANKRLERLARVRGVIINGSGELHCPILYIGCSNSSLQRRMGESMWLAHTVNHPLWALLHSGWTLELAFRAVPDY
jgi:hypothetical protein